MTLLAQRFPRLSMLPHIPLCQKSNVAPLEQLSKKGNAELWIKRDDENALPYGGNKVRKLEYLLADARQKGKKTLVTAGGYGSHHVLATSIYGEKWGFDVHAVMIPQPITNHVKENLRAHLAAHAVLHPVRGWMSAPPKIATLMSSLYFEGQRPYRIPYGGSSSLGALGFVEAGLELAKQIETGECPQPDTIYIALGSGGTASGLAIGLAAAGLPTNIIAVRVTPALICNQATLATLIGTTLRTLRHIEPSFPAVGRLALSKIRIDGSMAGNGYGVVDTYTHHAIEQAALEDFSVDPTYTARALNALMRDAKRRDQGASRLLFWLTLSKTRPSAREEIHLPPWAR